MSSAKTFHCSVVTPESIVLECDATFVALPAHDGEMGILVNRAPLLCKLDVGQLRVEGPETKESLYIDGGFAEMSDNRLTILTEDAKRPEELDRQSAAESLEAARKLKAQDDASFEARVRALKRAKAQLKISSEETVAP
jgi:F-type H+-transporting ATPase subunit epsilon